ncbi:MAG TPA: DMT family transporter [Streptosporangiaceae bacterium]|nr:DMT family transporter [Streptosporangiaceae bacterium]
MEARNNVRGAVGAFFAMTCVGTLTAVSAALRDYPVYGGQAIRYTMAALCLFLVDSWRFPHRRGAAVRDTPRVNGRDGVLLVALAAIGLAGFNVCIVVATRYTNPAAIGMMIATAPVVLALAGPVQQGRRPSATVLVAALTVAIGAGVANGMGRYSLLGLLLSLGALAGEVGFSLLAVPLLPKLGPVRVSAWAAGLAALMLLVTGLIVDGTGVVRVPTPDEALGLAYLGLGVTTVAFVAWFDALGRLGAARASLFAGVVPISAVVTTAVLGLGTPRPADLAGAGLVATGVVLGMRSERVQPECVQPECVQPEQRAR